MEKNKIYNKEFNIKCVNNSSSSNEYTQIDMLFQNGIQGNNFLFYYTDKYFYIKINDTRCFKFSMRRAKNSLHLDNEQSVKELFYKHIKKIWVEKQNENLFHLNVVLPLGTNQSFNYINKIKIKEVNDFINLSNFDAKDMIIKKQRDKITYLLNKISEYENKFKEPTTDEEMFIIYK